MPVYKASKLKPLLLKLAREQHRQLFLLCGEHNWAAEQLSALFNFDSNTLLLSKHPDIKQAIWPEHLHQILGQEFDIAVYDGYAGIEPNKLAALSGTIKAGGLLVLIIPELEDLDAWLDPGIHSCCSFGFKVLQSPFLKRWQTLLTQSRLSSFSQRHGLYLQLDTTSPLARTHFDEQTQVVSQLSTHLQQKQAAPALLTADRGRGKSAALGLLAGAMKECSFVICAMQYQAVKNTFKHLADAMGIPYQGHEKQLANIRYLPPDELLKARIENDIILVDEAASIPVPVLIKITEQGQPCVFSSTMIGYEGNGRGYTLRFKRFLEAHYPKFISLQLNQPIRYQANDPLEKQINTLFALDCRYQAINHISTPSFTELKTSTLAQDEHFLQQVFALLVLAHYQTTVSDLRQLLDSPSQRLFAVSDQNNLLGLCLVNMEGQLPSELNNDIAAGKRRPQGHLLPQQLFAIQGHTDFLNSRFARVVRIVVAPSVHKQTLGSQLLSFTEQQLHHEVDYIGSSFGANAQLVNFWQKNHFKVVKLGFKQDKASGEYAAMVLKSINKQSTQALQDLQYHFQTSFYYQLLSQYQLLPSSLVLILVNTFSSQEIPAHWINHLNYMAKKLSHLEQDSSTLWHILTFNPKLLLSLSDVSQHLAIGLLLQNNSKAWCLDGLKLESKKQRARAFKTLVLELHAAIKSLP